LENHSNGIVLGEESYDRFITFGDSFGFRAGKSLPTKVSNIDIKYIREYNQNDSISKGVLYRK